MGQEESLAERNSTSQWWVVHNYSLTLVNLFLTYLNATMVCVGEFSGDSYHIKVNGAIDYM